ncbi:MAG: Nramp family divalent metal transporter [Planctomycetia bacterium]
MSESNSTPPSQVSSSADKTTADTIEEKPADKNPWWKSIGPALITACVVFGPGSLVISSKVGATYGYELLWLLVLNGILMGTFLTMGARIGVVGGATPCQLLAKHANRPIAFITGLTLCLVATAFQFSNNLAVALAAGAFAPEQAVLWIVIGLNVAIAVFLFTAKQVYKAMERMIKVMVGVILICFLFNLIAAFIKEQPAAMSILGGFIPGVPEDISFGLPKIADGKLAMDPMVLIASLVGTTLSIAGAFFQGNLVRERKWTINDYEGSIGDSIAGVCVIVGVSMIIMMTAATVLLGNPADNIGDLALSLQPLLGNAAYWIFCIGLVAVAINPFMINAIIGGTILADAAGTKAGISDRLPRIFTIIVMTIGMGIALKAMQSGAKPVNLMILGQALTVIGNPLMAASLLWLANNKKIMGERRNGWLANTLGGIGFLVVLLLAIRVLIIVVLKIKLAMGA